MYSALLQSAGKEVEGQEAGQVKHSIYNFKLFHPLPFVLCHSLFMEGEDAIASRR
jgi:hypothetical protein